MNRVAALVIAGGLVLGTASSARAQFSMSIGNGYNGYGYGNNTFIGTGGYNSYFGAPGAYGLNGVIAPAPTYYNSGYYGVAPAPIVVPSYGVRPYGYGYGVRPYGYGYRRGFGPFGRGWR